MFTTGNILALSQTIVNFFNTNLTVVFSFTENFKMKVSDWAKQMMNWRVIKKSFNLIKKDTT